MSGPVAAADDAPGPVAVRDGAVSVAAHKVVVSVAVEGVPA
ncbi:hypothetical protein ACN28C_14955 [Plantactinospora sp. WMMC1484]